MADHHTTSNRVRKRFHFWFGRMRICDHLQFRIGRLGFDVTGGSAAGKTRPMDSHATPYPMVVRCLDAVTESQLDEIKAWVGRNLETALDEADHCLPTRILVACVLIEVDRA